MPLNQVPTIVPGDIGTAAYMNFYLRDNMNALIGLVGSQNLLVNPGFEVYQRGINVPANNLAYLVDRWQIVLGSGSSTFDAVETTVVDAASAASLMLNYTHSAASRLEQKVEDFRALRSKTITFTIRVRSGVVGAVRPYINDTGAYTYGAAIAATGSFQTLTVTATIGAAASSVNVGVELGATAVVYVDNAVLAYGSIAPDYVPLHASDDLARCQRYYEVMGAHMTGVATAGGQQIGGFVPFAVTKGGAPTVTKNGTWTATNCGQPQALSRPSAETRGVVVFATSTAAGQVDCIIGGAGQNITAEWNPA